MARIIAGVSSSHVPAIGAAIDNHQTEEPYWKRVFSGFEKSQAWLRDLKPDVAIALDVTLAGDTPATEFRQLPIRLGGGPAKFVIEMQNAECNAEIFFERHQQQKQRHRIRATRHRHTHAIALANQATTPNSAL